MKKTLETKEEIKEFNRDSIKVHGVKRFLNSVKYSVQGLSYSYKSEQSFWLHAGATILAIILGIICKLKALEWAIIILALGIILAIELINTAIEAAVDLTTTQIHPLAKIAKDCGSAASFVMSIITFIIALLIYVPHFLEMFEVL